jgi:uncharacterized tellurite resistance protein B-like protein
MRAGLNIRQYPFTYINPINVTAIIARMATKEKLYEAFGELIYAVAKADGMIQGEEVEVLEKIVKNHQWAEDIVWSFNYERKKDLSVEYVYRKAIDIFQEHGPDPEYASFLTVLEEIAQASQGKSAQEQGLINLFQMDLIKKFKEDLNIQ